VNLPDLIDRDVVVIGGCGHVGLPLALAFADRGARVAIYDLSESAVALVNSGRMPFA
jgi:UDP-N-acetyl-D-mannosaminuronic acid dehydrogenase